MLLSDEGGILPLDYIVTSCCGVPCPLADLDICDNYLDIAVASISKNSIYSVLLSRCYLM